MPLDVTASRDPELEHVIRAMEDLVFNLPKSYQKRAVTGMKTGLLGAMYGPWQSSVTVREAIEKFERVVAGQEPWNH